MGHVTLLRPAHATASVLQVLDVLPLADTVTKLAARCAYCGLPALFSLRIAADARQEVVGGADKYAPVCRRHYAALETRLRPEPITPDPSAAPG